MEFINFTSTRRCSQMAFSAPPRIWGNDTPKARDPAIQIAGSRARAQHSEHDQVVTPLEIVNQVFGLATEVIAGMPFPSVTPPTTTVPDAHVVFGAGWLSAGVAIAGAADVSVSWTNP